MRILGADDQQNVRRVVERMLEHAGHQVTMLSDGKALLDELARSGADLVLLDLKMEGLSGMEVCERIRSDPDLFAIPILMLSGVEDEDVILEALQRGADDYILKPFSRAELAAKVHFAFHRRRQASRPRLELQAGTRFADRFEIRRQLGSGGFSVVLLAYDALLRKDVALKVFDAPVTQVNSPEGVQMLLREAYELSKLDCSGIVKFHDFGQANTLYYLVMEYLDGKSLKDHIATEGPMSEFDVIVLIRELCRVVAYLAERDMMHGDIKPSNIMIGVDGRIKLVDFGLVRSFADGEGKENDDEAVLSPIYAAPESFFEGIVPDVRSEIYSLGAAAFYAACGEDPFPHGDVDAIVRTKASESAPRVRFIRPELSEELDELIAEMLSREPEDRPDLQQLKAQVERLIAAQ
ncbi:MAG: protein kinase domain-containing protein [Verrucomicrobiota bacterium]